MENHKSFRSSLPENRDRDQHTYCLLLHSNRNRKYQNLRFWAAWPQPHYLTFKSSQFVLCCCSVAKSCLTLCNPTDCSTPGFPVLHYLPEFAQTHVHWLSDAIQPPHPLSPTSPPALNLSQHQSLFQWVSSSHQVAKVLEFQLQHQSFHWIFRVDFL